MTLLDLRKAAIRKQAKIAFPLRNGLECVIGEDGVARVPQLNAAPDFNLERDLEAAQAFTLEPALASKGATKTKATSLNRVQIAALVLDIPASSAQPDHDDE
jgi:hypothetical protein